MTHENATRWISSACTRFGGVGSLGKARRHGAYCQLERSLKPQALRCVSYAQGWEIFRPVEKVWKGSCRTPPMAEPRKPSQHRPRRRGRPQSGQPRPTGTPEGLRLHTLDNFRQRSWSSLFVLSASRSKASSDGIASFFLRLRRARVMRAVCSISGIRTPPGQARSRSSNMSTPRRTRNRRLLG